MNELDPLERTILVAIAVFGLYMMAWAAVMVYVESSCLAAGYRKSNVDFFLNGYCTRTVNMTDVTVPVSRARP